MRRTLLLFLAVVISLMIPTSVHFSQPKGWTVQKNTGNELNGVSFIDRYTGWAVGGFSTTQTVEKTTDGGKTWTPQTTGQSGFLYNVYAIDASTIVASGRDGIVRSTDGGTTWSTVYTSSLLHLKGLAFVNSTTGWAVGIGAVRKTTNGGASWFTQTSNTTGNLNAVAFASATIGVAIGQQSSTEQTRIRTTNAGTTWTAHSVSGNTPMLGIDFADATVGVAVGKNGRFTRSASSGGSWSSETAAAGLAVQLNAVAFGTSSHGWAVSDFGDIILSTDAGTSWGSQESDAGSTSLNSVHFIDQYVGTIVGGGGLVMRTTTGGEAAEITVTGGAYSLGTFDPSTTNNAFLRIEASIDVGGSVVLESLEITTGGSYAALDIDAFKLWYDDVQDFDANTATLLSTVASATGNGETLTFEGFAQDITSSTGYFFVTADIDESPGITTLSGSLTAFSDMGFSIAGTIPASNVSNVFPISGDSEVLPVQIASFTALTSGPSTELRWRTETETGNFGFEIERRVIDTDNSPFTIHDSPHWRVIGFVPGAGTSSSPKDYSFQDKPGQPGRYAYRLKQIDHSGAFAYTQATEVEIAALPADFAVVRSYPNPFNPDTMIEFSIPIEDHVSLRVFDLLGREVALLVDEVQPAGTIVKVPFSPDGLSSGTYILQMRYRGTMQSTKLLLSK